MSDRHLRVLGDAARVAARRLRDHRETTTPGVDPGDNRDRELRRSAAQARDRFTAALRRRATTIRQ
jgi:hypothetical protein